MKSITELEMIAILGGADSDSPDAGMPVCTFPPVPDSPDFNLNLPSPGPADPLRDGAPDGEVWYAS